MRNHPMAQSKIDQSFVGTNRILHYQMIYLAHPYRHDDKAVMATRYGEARLATQLLLKCGYTVYSPILHSAAIGIIGFDFWKEHDLNFVDRCDAVFVLNLKGWELSVGVTEEIRHAKSKNIPVHLITIIHDSITVDSLPGDK